MKLIDKIRNIKVNSKLVIIISILMLPIIIGYGINYCFYSPSPINRFIASNIYKTPANKAFDDDNFYQCVVDSYNEENKTTKPYSTSLSDSQLKSITNLDCYKRGIKSAKGVEKLTSLTSLDVRYNQLTSLDVSKNTALDRLFAESNQLESLELETNVNLIWLDVSLNRLKKLSLIKNTNLMDVDVSNNYIEELNVSKNNKLERLNVGYICISPCIWSETGYSNLLTNLDVSKNENLIELRVSYNKLTSLDVSKNEKLTSLFVDGNQLTNLNVNEATSLRNLGVNNNQLTNLNVSELKSLTYLDASGNPLNDNLNPIFVGQKVNLDNLKKIVKLPNHFVPTITTRISSGLEERDEGVFATRAGGQSYIVRNNISDYNSYEETYYIEVVGKLQSNKYTINGREYIYIGNDKYTNVLDNLSVENGQLELDTNNKLVIKSGETKMATVDILRLNVKNSNYVFGDNYIYLNGEIIDSISSNIEVLNGNEKVNADIKIENDSLIIEYNGIELENLRIVRLSSDKYNIAENIKAIYIHADDYSVIKNNVSCTNCNIVVDKENNKLKMMVSNKEIVSYEIFKLDLLNEAYVLGDDYIGIGVDSDEEVLNNVKLIRSGKEYTSGIEIVDGYLKVSAGVMNKFDDLKIIRTSSNVYDLSKDYIYVGTASDEEIINNIETTANITINNNILNITYSTDYKISYKLIRLNKTSAQYKIGDDYIYVLNDSDEKILSKVQLLNGTDIVENSLSIDGDKLIVKYNNVVLDNLKIIRSTINKYNVNEMSNFVYLRTDDYDDLRENVIVDNGTFIVDEEAGHLRIMYNDIQLNRYEIIKLNILNESYILTDNYIYVGTDSYDDVLNNVKLIRSGQEYTSGIKIKDGRLNVSLGAITYENLKIIRTSSSVYDLSKDYIYVGTDSNEEIINNIEATANISINNNILSITYEDIYNVSYKLVRLDTEYDISKGYIYTFDDDYMNNISVITVINGSKEIIDDNLIIKYNNIELDRIPILNLYSDIYIINDAYIYTGLSDIDLSKITTSNNLGLSIDINKVILTYKGEFIDEIPYYHLSSNSDYIRFSARENKIYVTNKMMTNSSFLNSISFSFDNDSIGLFDKNGNRISSETDGYNYLVETGNYILTKGFQDIKYYIELTSDYINYSPDAEVHYTENYGIDILKNLNTNNTFINVKDLIFTSGNLSILDKDDKKVTDQNSNIKTGDKFVVSFSNYRNHYIYLSVKGDVTGRGNIDNDDVLESYSILRGSKVEDYYRFASDINNDGKTKINDVAKLYQYVNNKIESLED